MSVSLDDIWDVPATALSVSRPSTSDVDIDDGEDELMPRSARKQPAQKLFLDSDSDDEGAAAVPGASHAPRTPARSVAPPIDHLFNNFDDDVEDNNGRPPPLTPHAILPSSSPPREGDDRAGKKEDKGKDGGDEKKRKPLPKLDESRLLGPDGFEALLAQMKGFKPKGKGHEQEDLNRLLQQYQFWAHKLYPKTHFRDTVKTVEKLCHSKRMHVALSVLRDKHKGLDNGPPANEDALDFPSDSDTDDARPEPRQVVPNSLGIRFSPLPTTRPPTAPPTSGSEGGFDDSDIDAMMHEDEQRAMRPSKSTALPTGNEIDDDLEFWQQLAQGAGDDLDIDLTHNEPSKPPATKPTTTSADDDFMMDEDAWDALDAMEREAGEKTAPKPVEKPPSEPSGNSAPPPLGNIPRPMTEEEEWESMYMS